MLNHAGCFSRNAFVLLMRSYRSAGAAGLRVLRVYLLLILYFSFSIRSNSKTRKTRKPAANKSGSFLGVVQYGQIGRAFCADISVSWGVVR